MGGKQEVRLAVLETKHKYESRLNRLQFKALAQALELANIEKERRLDSLNGEAGRLAKVLAESMPRELAESKFAQQAKDLAELRLLVTSGGSDLTGRRAGFAPYVDIVKGVILLAAGAALTWLLKR
jgi:hypothetical protein